MLEPRDIHDEEPVRTDPVQTNQSFLARYYQNLKDHPGLPFGLLYTLLLIAVAGDEGHPLMGLVVGAFFPWSIILTTAWPTKKNN